MRVMPLAEDAQRADHPNERQLRMRVTCASKNGCEADEGYLEKRADIGARGGAYSGER